jgi:hypothetical protein
MTPTAYSTFCHRRWPYPRSASILGHRSLYVTQHKQVDELINEAQRKGKPILHPEPGDELR